VSRRPDTVVGRIPVLECLRAAKRRPRKMAVLRSAKGLDPIIDMARGIPVEEVSREALDRMAGGATHQGVVLEADPLPVLRLDDWLHGPLAPGALVVVLDGIEDPHNFGAIVRSAAACGAAGVVFGKDRAAPLSATAIKAAAGAMEHVDLIRVTNLVRSIQALQQAGFWIAGLDAQAQQLLWQADLSGRTGLVVGSEGRGMRRLVRERCDLLLRIPLTGPITSLNASASAAVALAECMRQRWARAR